MFWFTTVQYGAASPPLSVFPGLARPTSAVHPGCKVHGLVRWKWTKQGGWPNTSTHEQWPPSKIIPYIRDDLTYVGLQSWTHCIMECSQLYCSTPTWSNSYTAGKQMGHWNRIIWQSSSLAGWDEGPGHRRMSQDTVAFLWGPSGFEPEMHFFAAFNFRPALHMHMQYLPS